MYVFELFVCMCVFEFVCVYVCVFLCYLFFLAGKVVRVTFEVCACVCIARFF